jgi:hypothetical protein
MNKIKIIIKTLIPIKLMFIKNKCLITIQAVPGILICLLTLLSCAHPLHVSSTPIYAGDRTPSATFDREALYRGWRAQDWEAHFGDQQQKIGLKQGKGCIKNFFGLIATGSASAVEIAKKAGIKKITSIDYTFEGASTFYGNYCVIVTGE